MSKQTSIETYQYKWPKCYNVKLPEFYPEPMDLLELLEFVSHELDFLHQESVITDWPRIQASCEALAKLAGDARQDCERLDQMTGRKVLAQWQETS